MTGVGRAVSVVIPHYGDPEPTRALVNALHAQRGVGTVQVIVVDDDSPEPFPDLDGVTLVRRTANGGFGSAVNSGVEQAVHDRLLILNSDLELTDDFVASMINASEPWMPAVTGPWIVDRAGAPAWSGRTFPTAIHQTVEWLTPLARVRHHDLLHRAVGHDLRCEAGATTVVDWLVGAALYLPTEVFRQIGGFDESFHMNSEEVDLQYRLGRVGVPSVQIGSVEVVHEGGGSSGDVARRRRWLVESRLRFADKWGTRRVLQGALSAATAVNLAHNVGRRALGRQVDPLGVARFEWSLIWRSHATARR